MLKLASKIFPILCVGQAMALPNPSTASGIVQTARFDNDQGLPAVGVSPINIYLDIFWKGMSLAETSNVQDLPGIIPNSPPNFATFSPKNAATLTQGTPEMTTVYDDSTVSYLNLYSFFYGCALGLEESLTSVPESCNITITGFDPSGKQVATQTFAFVADGLSQQMIQAIPKGFNGVQFITFAFQAAAGVVAIIDTVNYTVITS